VNPSHHDLLVRASRLYFELGETQDRVAEVLGIHRSQVSRLLKEARAMGVVEITVHDGRVDDHLVVAELQRRFGVRDAHLVGRIGGAHGMTRRLVGMEAARLLRSAVRSGMVVGIGGGATTGAMVDALATAPVSVALTVIPLMGGLGSFPGPMDHARRLADVLGGRAIELPAPGFVADAAMREALLDHAAVREVTDRWARLDVTVVGVGSMETAPAWYGPDLEPVLAGMGAAGEVLAWPYDLAGRAALPDLAARMVAVPPDRLVRVPLALFVACGDDKVDPLLGALRAGWIRTLVSDIETVRAVLDRDDAAPGSHRSTIQEQETGVGR
jgi:DNA-binding transcriptional regulator LsrR (DeoR family)